MTLEDKRFGYSLMLISNQSNTIAITVIKAPYVTRIIIATKSLQLSVGTDKFTAPVKIFASKNIASPLRLKALRMPLVAFR